MLRTKGQSSTNNITHRELVHNLPKTQTYLLAGDAGSGIISVSPITNITTSITAVRIVHKRVKKRQNNYLFLYLVA